MEKREIPLPILIAQGVKGEPHIGSFDLGEESIGPTQKMSPSTTQPGCAYTSRLTRGVTRVVKGDKALYEKGRYYYYHRDFEEAFETFQRLIRVYPQSPWRGAAFYWAGEATFHQGKTKEAFSYFQKVVDEDSGNEFYPYALYSSGWIQRNRGHRDKIHCPSLHPPPSENRRRLPSFSLGERSLLLPNKRQPLSRGFGDILESTFGRSQRPLQNRDDNRNTFPFRKGLCLPSPPS